ncbi:CCAAT/enhancer-binding protein zeta isoform X2 [Genypterus blacodes]|uniref:CCAAT/enhancer-binding protein zeta isoform X2 n=1 Tax=Genypterus blacodes TaxID=154954 RepID=UPI003F7572D4
MKRLFISGSRVLMLLNMAAKTKHRKKDAKETKMTFKEEESKPENENHNEEEEEEDDEAEEEEEGRAMKDEELNLEEVLRLGGTKADFMLIAGLDDSNELVDGGKKGAIDDLEEGELQAFISKLGLPALAGQQVIADEPQGGAVEKESKKAKAKKATAEQRAPPDGPGAPPKTRDPKVPAGKKSKQSADLFEFQPRKVLLVRPGGKWFDLEYSAEDTSEPQDPALVARYKTLAQQLLGAEVDLYRTKKNLQKGANSAWMKTVVSSGVLADRMAAMTVLIQDAPVHSLDHVESLVSMVKKKGSRRMGLMALDTLRELLLSDLLPEDRKLRPFAQRPFDLLEDRASGNRDARDRRLVLWYFEHLLKHHVADFVEALDAVAHDTVSATKSKALNAAHELLCGRPEQERALLIQIVNKLGDPEYKTAAKASHLLEAVLHKHPNMKAVVCGEVERLMFRPNVGRRAQYYGVCFLSQVLLSHDEAPLASRLIAVYFSFFHACVKTKDLESKMLSALLSGVNRAFPYASSGDEKVKEQLDTLFRVVHLVKFNTAVQALMLLFQVMDAQQTVSDRYYAALYRKLLDPGLSSSSRQSMFLNLLFKSLKADIVLRRVKAFVKRLLQVSAQQSPSFACGALFLLSEVMKVKPGLRTLLEDQEDEEEEKFKDLAEDEEEEKRDEGAAAEEEAKPASSWVHQQNLEGGRSFTKYDPLHRNPLFCGADHTALWELHRLTHHFHPSVSLFAQTVLQGGAVQYSGDPLQDFTLSRFLDRFVFRNPKQLKSKLGTEASVLQPRHRSAVHTLAVNGEEFVSKDESQIPVDQLFFYRFFKRRQQEKQKLRPQRGGGDEDSVEDVDDDEFEKLLDSCEGDSYFADLQGEERLDFAGNVKKKTKAKKDAEDSDSDDSDIDDLDEEEMSLGSMDEEDFGEELEEEGGTFMDPEAGGEEEEQEEEEGRMAEFDEDEDEDDEDSRPKRKRSAATGFQAKKKKKSDAAVFASAEEFGELLDENFGSKFDSVGMNAMANTDKAGLKQLKWEAQRDDWMQGRDAKTLRQKKSAFNKRKTMGRARTGGRTFARRK